MPTISRLEFCRFTLLTAAAAFATSCRAAPEPNRPALITATAPETTETIAAEIFEIAQGYPPDWTMPSVMQVDADGRPLIDIFHDDARTTVGLTQRLSQMITGIDDPTASADTVLLFSEEEIDDYAKAHFLAPKQITNNTALTFLFNGVRLTAIRANNLDQLARDRLSEPLSPMLLLVFDAIHEQEHRYGMPIQLKPEDQIPVPQPDGGVITMTAAAGLRLYDTIPDLLLYPSENPDGYATYLDRPDEAMADLGQQIVSSTAGLPVLSNSEYRAYATSMQALLELLGETQPNDVFTRWVDYARQSMVISVLDELIDYIPDASKLSLPHGRALGVHMMEWAMNGDMKPIKYFVNNPDEFDTYYQAVPPTSNLPPLLAARRTRGIRSPYYASLHQTPDLARTLYHFDDYLA